jgi:hypothetical protein
MKKLTIYIIFLCLVLNACNTDKSVLSQISQPAKPSQGKASAVGQVIDKKTGNPIVGIIVRLAEVYREGEGGVFMLDFANSPGTRTDEKGFFTFIDILPGEYVMAIGEGDNFNNYDVVEDSVTGKPKVWEVKTDQINDWGVSKAEVLFR